VDSTGPVRDVLYAISAVSFYKLSLMMVVFYCLWVFLLVLSILGTGRAYQTFPCPPRHHRARAKARALLIHAESPFPPPPPPPPSTSSSSSSSSQVSQHCPTQVNPRFLS